MAGPREWLKQMLIVAGRQLVAPRESPRVVILCYHSVSTTPLASATPKAFEQHLQWLRAHCDLISFGQAVHPARHGRGDRPAVAITFDDGYADNHACAFPLLQRYAVPATFFLTAGLLERDPEVLGRLRGLYRAGPEDICPLEWSQVREMQQAGMEVGAHTYSHPNLSRLAPAAAGFELRHAKAILEERLGARVTAMAYPFGIPRCHFTRETMALASAAGYDCAAAIAFRAVQPTHSRYAIPRFPVTQAHTQSLPGMVYGAWDLLGLWQERAPVVFQRRRWDLTDRP